LRSRILIAALAAASLAAPATAAAEPDRTATLSADAAEFTFDGTSASGTHVYESNLLPFDPEFCSKTPDSYCDITHFEIKSGGPVGLRVSLDEFTTPVSDFDLYVYKSDAAGAVGTEVDNSGNIPGEAEEVIVSGAAPGYYLAVVPYFFVPGGGFKGTIAVTDATPVGEAPPAEPPPGGDPAPAPPPPGGGDPAPSPPAAPAALPFKAAKSIGSARKARKSKRLAFRVSAGEAISGLTVQLRKGSKVLGTARLASLPKGSRTLKLRVKRLKAGSYTLVATGSVGGAQQTATQKVRVKK